jgi:hypothetical protein
VSNVHGPFFKFEDAMTDAVKRAPFVEQAFIICLKEQIFAQMDGNTTSHHAEEIIDRLASQCGLVIDVRYFDDATIYSYELVDLAVEA